MKLGKEASFAPRRRRAKKRSAARAKFQFGILRFAFSRRQICKSCGEVAFINCPGNIRKCKSAETNCSDNEEESLRPERLESKKSHRNGRP
jgi:hypothetical protein